MIGRVDVGAWGMIAAIAGILSVPFLWAGFVAIDSPDALYRLVLHADPGDGVAPEVDLDSTRQLGVFLLVAGGILVASSIAAVVMLFRWKSPRRRAGPTDEPEMSRNRNVTRPGEEASSGKAGTL